MYIYDLDTTRTATGLQFLFNYHLVSLIEHKTVNDNWELIPNGIHSQAAINQYTDIYKRDGFVGGQTKCSPSHKITREVYKPRRRRN